MEHTHQVFISDIMAISVCRCQNRIFCWHLFSICSTSESEVVDEGQKIKIDQLHSPVV